MTSEKFDSFAQDLANVLAKHNATLTASEGLNGIEISVVERFSNDEPIFLSDCYSLTVKDLEDNHEIYANV